MNRKPPNSEKLQNRRDQREQQNAKLKEIIESKKAKLQMLLEIGSVKCIAEPRRPYFSYNPWKSPSFFPQRPMAQYVTPAFYLKLSEDTLFFIFYYFPHTIHQKLAGWGLRRHQWRYHRKYLSWFQRTEEPYKITDTYEHGCYYVFDSEAWKRVVRDDFTFYYTFLV